jgi:predicted Ser/Thr protein kinase
LGEIEEILVSPSERKEDFRNGVISQIGAYSLDHPGEPPDYRELFAAHLRRLQEDFFNKRRKLVRRARENFLKVIHGDLSGMDAKEQEQVRTMLATMRARFGYCEHCANDMVAFLMKKRYAD